MKVITIKDQPGKVPPKHYDLLGQTIADESMGAKKFRVGFTRMDKTGRCDPHVHDSAEQLFIVLKGAMKFNVDGKEFTVKEGQAVLVLAGEEHSNINATPEVNTEYLTVTG